MTNNRIIDLTKKLIRHERSARKCSTPEEAAAFAAKIQQLCIENKIAVEQIDLTTEDTEKRKIGEEVFSAHRTKYRGRGVYVDGQDSRLMRVVSAAHFCQAIVIKGTNCILIVGEEQDRAVTVAMFQFLRRTMRSAATAEEALQLKRRRPIRKFRHYFCLGFINVIDERYREMRAAAENTTTALVRADALVKRYVTEKFEVKESTRRKPKGRMNLDAIFAGSRHAHQVSLSKAVMGQSAKRQEQRLIGG